MDFSEKAEFVGTRHSIDKNNDHLRLRFLGLMSSLMTRLLTEARGERSFSLAQTRAFVSQNKLQGKLYYCLGNGKEKFLSPARILNNPHIRHVGNPLKNEF